MTNSFTNIFGGGTIRPTYSQYEAIALSGDISLVWPLETTESEPYVAAQIDVTPSTTGLTIAMPPGNTGSTGVATIITNVGASTFVLADTSGNAIVSIAAGITWIISLIDNTTTNGTWRTYQLGATSSSADAAALAGRGLQAVANKLLVYYVTSLLTTNTTITATYGAHLVVWTGAGTGTLQLDTITNLTVGWWAAFRNDGGGAVTISTSGGATIDGAGTLVLQAGASAFVICAADGFRSVGGVPSPLSIANGGTGATTALGALENFGGTSIGISIFTAPSAAAVVSLLGLNAIQFTEATVNTNQNLNTGNSNTVYVCTAAINVTLVLSTSVTRTYVIIVDAQGGDVTMIPAAGEAIAGQAADTHYVLSQGSSAMFVTDAAGNWWPVLTGAPPVRAPAAAATIALTIADSYVLVDTSSAATTVNLPAGPTPFPITVKDSTGDAATNPITITPAAGLIDGRATQVMNTPRGALVFVYNTRLGTWNIV